jgi:hypothetical protein
MGSPSGAPNARRSAIRCGSTSMGAISASAIIFPRPVAGRMPVVFLQGDYLGKLDLKTLTWIDPSDTADIDTDNLMRMADAFSKMAKTTAIYLARIGVEGTSGNHIARKTLLELHLMNAALDAIKQRHNFLGFHLVGQSGGSKLVGGLIGLRRDVACAVSGSGPLASPNAMAHAF